MDCMKIGQLIARFRKEKGLTQKNIADALGVSHKTVSKWECGVGCADLSYWPDLSAILGVDMAQIMEGEITRNKPDSGNIDKVRFYICPICGNTLVSTGSASIFCCGRKQEPLMAKEMDEAHCAQVETLDNERYITFAHEMRKEHWILFAAWVSLDRVLMVRMYPEQGGEARIPFYRRGRLYLGCNNHGLFYRDFK